MQLYNTSQYAIRILDYIANQKGKALLNAKELADTLAIPYKFLTKIMAELVRVDFVKSVRGRKGGYALHKPASEIVISDILDLFNDSIHEKRCILGIGFCDSSNKCALHDQWVEPRALIQQMFQRTTLADLAQKGCKI